MAGDLWLMRHGETEWSRSGAHTGNTDLPLTEAGVARAKAIGRFLAGLTFALVLTSPLKRARETCRLAGYGEAAEIEANLREWNYGDYEGLTTAEIRAKVPDWSIWSMGVSNGESIDEVAARARAVIERASTADGNVALFAHGHILRVLTARWLGLGPADGRLFSLSTASVSILGHERETRVITLWNMCLDTP